MQVLFPPGDTSWKNTKVRSVWREFKFALNQVCKAIEPEFALEDMLTQWNEISEGLAESPRKRKAQLSKFFEYKTS